MTNEHSDRDGATTGLTGALVSLVVVVAVLTAGYLLYTSLGRHVTIQYKPTVKMVQADSSYSYDRVENNIHVETGLIYGAGFDAVRKNCTGCHSPQLITQNRATREGWHQMIRWMQETQGLWDLGSSEAVILDYLAEHYAPEDVGRRPNLDLESIEWYALEREEWEGRSENEE